MNKTVVGNSFFFDFLTIDKTFLSITFFFYFHHRFVCAFVQKSLHCLEALSIADMGLIPYELLVPFGQLKALNLSGNHLVNVSMQIIHPVNGLEVCQNQLMAGKRIFKFQKIVLFHPSADEKNKIYRFLFGSHNYLFIMLNRR